MYSPYPRWRNNGWVKIRDKIIKNINPFRDYGLITQTEMLCKFMNHPEAKSFLHCVKFDGLDKNRLKLIAEEQGSVLAVAIFGFYFFDINQTERLEWFAKLLEFGQYGDFLTMIEPYVRWSWKTDNHISHVHIGRYLIKDFDFTLRRIFGIYVNNDMFEFTERSIECYIKQMNRCRKAVDTWTLVGLRFRVVKDIRNLIAKLIWESRNEEIYFY